MTPDCVEMADFHLLRYRLDELTSESGQLEARLHQLLDQLCKMTTIFTHKVVRQRQFSTIMGSQDSRRTDSSHASMTVIGRRFQRFCCIKKDLAKQSAG
ncbi:unnamed protein product [Protopolystoma xenopodis]|uniref:Uncharacterized protein n=1 Tax=Protopolystoma xenopodis TaxID=117903 RepID=A0A448WMU8_9PLAT|nr:unnamed protein product [Protopolystoma xenopodis]